MKTERIPCYVPDGVLLSQADALIEKLKIENAELRVEIGKLKAYIDELEDADKKDVVREARLRRKKDEEWKSMLTQRDNQSKRLRMQKDTIDGLIGKLHLLKVQRDEICERVSAYIRGYNPEHLAYDENGQPVMCILADEIANMIKETIREFEDGKCKSDNV